MNDIIYVEKRILRNLNKLKDKQLPSKYLADSKGNVYIHNNSLPSKKINNIVKIPVRKMKPYTTRLGYVEYVVTNKAGVKKHLQAHRIVAILFIPNPKKLPHVNHKDGNRSNNVVGNLEWTSISDNIKHSYKYLRKG
jgi:hypothetical protein